MAFQTIQGKLNVFEIKEGEDTGLFTKLNVHILSLLYILIPINIIRGFTFRIQKKNVLSYKSTSTIFSY